MTKCVVCGVTYSSKHVDVSFHRVPKLLKPEWETAIGLELTEQDRVCSIHFSEDDIQVIGAKRCLKQNAVPSLLIASQEQSMFIETVNVRETIRFDEEEYGFNSSRRHSFTLNDDDDYDSDRDSVSPPRNSKKMVVRYPGDISKSSLYDPKVAEKSISVLQKSLADKKQKLKFFQLKCRRLTNRVKSLEELVEQLRAKIYLNGNQAQVFEIE